MYIYVYNIYNFPMLPSPKELQQLSPSPNDEGESQKIQQLSPSPNDEGESQKGESCLVSERVAFLFF